MRCMQLTLAIAVLCLTACGGSGGGNRQADAPADLPAVPVSKLAGVWKPASILSGDQLEISDSGQVIDPYDRYLTADLTFTEVRPGQFEAVTPEGKTVTALMNIETERYVLWLWEGEAGVAMERAPTLTAIRPVSDDSLRDTRWQGLVANGLGDNIMDHTTVSLWIEDDMSFSLVYGDGRVVKQPANTEAVFAASPDQHRLYLAGFEDDGDSFFVYMVLSDDEGGLVCVVGSQNLDDAVEYWVLTPEAR